MALARGTRLGPYQIESPIGAGGMGEVYRATDTRLERTVAIKVLPAHVASDPDLKQRFEREAKIVYQAKLRRGKSSYLRDWLRGIVARPARHQARVGSGSGSVDRI